MIVGDRILKAFPQLIVIENRPNKRNKFIFLLLVHQNYLIIH